MTTPELTPLVKIKAAFYLPDNLLIRFRIHCAASRKQPGDVLANVLTEFLDREDAAREAERDEAQGS